MKTSLPLYLDMDGCITDFESAFKHISGGLSPDEYRTKFGKNTEATLFLSKGSDFWENLQWITGGRELLQCALDNFNVVRILTSAGTGPDKERYAEVRAGKMAWLAKNAPMIPQKNIIVVPACHAKQNYATPNAILVDDKDTTILEWMEKGGIGIHHNSNFWNYTTSALLTYSSFTREEPIRLKEIVRSL